MSPDGPAPTVLLGTAIIEPKQRDETLREHELQLRAIVDNVPGVVYRRVRHADGRITFPYYSSQLGPRYGVDAAGLANDATPLLDAIHPEDRALWLAAIEQSASGLTPFEIDYRFRSRTGDWRWVRSLATPTERDDGSVSWDGISFDVTELKATEQALRESEERYRRLVEASPDAIVIHHDGRIRFANLRAAELAGVAGPGELVGRPIADLLDRIGPLDHEPGTRRRADRGAVAEAREARIQRADGQPIPVEVTAVAIADGGRPAVQIVLRDISKRKRAQEALRESEERYRGLIQTAPIALLIHRQGRIRFANAKASELFGVGVPSALRGRSLISFVWHEDRPIVRLLMRRLRERRGLAEPCEIRLCRLDGTLVDVEFSALGITEHGAPAVQVVLLDVTARKRAEARIRYFAHHDVLTGLPNRALLQDRLQQSLAQARRDKQKLAVMMLDLDHFKDVNDTLGHPVGDQLLCAVARRLRSIVRESDTLARFGGDEFVLIQTVLNDRAGAGILARKIADTLAEPYVVDGHEVRTSASLGIAVYPDDGKVPDTLLKSADMALYRAKAGGRASFEFYLDEMRSEVHTRKALEDDLRRGLERSEFRLLYQPQIALDTGRLIGVEALLRWCHPEHGVMVPRTFLPLAERTGLIGPIGQWVLEEACRQASAWARAGTATRVGVNLATAQCRQPGFVAALVGLLERFDLAAGLLDLEITESWLLGSCDGHVSSNLLRLSALGVTISIDDLGTGHSSLSDLKRLPIDHIKLACPFVAGIGRSVEDEAITRALITLGHSLDKRVIAEGVETEEQRRFLCQLGCDYAQGRLFGDAMPAEEIGRWLAAGAGLPATTALRDPAPAAVPPVRAQVGAAGRPRPGRRRTAARPVAAGSGND